MSNSKKVITASEVAQYIFCPYSLLLKYRGIEVTSVKHLILAQDGVQYHIKKEKTIQKNIERRNSGIKLLKLILIIIIILIILYYILK